jgi:hypothetical protein
MHPKHQIFILIVFNQIVCVFQQTLHNRYDITPKCPLEVVVRENYTIKLQGTEIFTRRCSISYIEDEKLSTEVILK